MQSNRQLLIEKINSFSVDWSVNSIRVAITKHNLSNMYQYKKPHSFVTDNVMQDFWKIDTRH